MNDEAKKLLREATSHLQSAIGLDDPSRKITIGDTCDLVTRIDAFLSRPEPAAQEPDFGDIVWEEMPDQIRQGPGRQLNETMKWCETIARRSYLLGRAAPPQIPSDARPPYHMVDRLAQAYRIDQSKVAWLCDEYLDRSGELLGRVRDAALRGSEAK
jgi:hypothetical protein